MAAIQFDQETMQRIVQEAIFNTMTPEARDELLKGAIRSLIEPEKGQYGREFPSKLQQAFSEAANRILVKLASEFFNADTPESAEVRDQLLKLVRDAYEKAVTGDNREKLIMKMAHTLSDVLRRES